MGTTRGFSRAKTSQQVFAISEQVWRYFDQIFASKSTCKPAKTGKTWKFLPKTLFFHINL
jgi:hypothetical protein